MRAFSVPPLGLTVLLLGCTLWGAQDPTLMKGALTAVPMPGEPFAMQGRSPQETPFFFAGTGQETPSAFECMDLNPLAVGGKPLVFSHQASPFDHHYGFVVPPKSRVRAQVDNPYLRVQMYALRIPGQPAPVDRPGMRGTDWVDYRNHRDVPIHIMCIVSARGSDTNQRYTLTLSRRE